MRTQNRTLYRGREDGDPMEEAMQQWWGDHVVGG